MNFDRRTEPEFSYIVDLAALPDRGETYAFSASATECSALSRRFGLMSVDRLDVSMVVSWLRRDRVLSIAGELDAVVIQTCVLTLEPVRSSVREKIELMLARDESRDASYVELDEAEPLEGNELDLGELAAEELALGLDPYPRSPDMDPALFELGPGATMSAEVGHDSVGDGANPFGKLAALKNRK